ncbi:proteasome subunit alpha type [Puccinia sorghi]|uniref:Proteasome subunit alpha type n=1 Tax=Puccinia sorghi TaxID=27349 RepID=A0A0L6UH27_9BASI|nr:proteasome subunit alpha type [Puccinia sorghi]
MFRNNKKTQFSVNQTANHLYSLKTNPRNQQYSLFAPRSITSSRICTRGGKARFSLGRIEEQDTRLASSSQSKTPLLYLSTGELASYQKKLIRIDDHIGIAIAGLTSDARVLSSFYVFHSLNFMRQQSMTSRLLHNRPLPLSRSVMAIADKAQVNTQEYGRRPYGVGFLIGGHDETGPHLYEFSPSGNCLEYYAMSIGARSQSAKTYLEKHFEKFLDCDLDELIKHGLHALRDTLQQDKELTTLNTSLGIVGPSHKFEIIEGDALAPYLARMDPKDDGTAQPAPMETDP